MNPMAAFAAAAQAATKELNSLSAQMRGFGGKSLIAGFDAISKSFQQIGSVIGMFLTPVLTVFAAGLMTVADYLMNEAKGALGGWTDGIINATSAALEWTKAIVAWYQDLQDKSAGLGETISRMVFGNIPEVGGGPHPGQVEAIRQKMGLPPEGGAGAAGGAGGAGGLDLRKTFAENLKGLAQEMRMGLAPSGYSGIADAAKRLQLQSFQSTIQQKMLSMFEQTVRSVEKIARGVDNMNPGLGTP